MSVGPRAYVTYFDQRYLTFAIIMLRSLRRHDPQAEIFALCFDQTAYEIIAELGETNIVIVSSRMIRDFEPGLAAHTDRTRKAFYATHKAVLPLYVLSQRPDLAAIAHIDADTCFFSSPAPLFKEIGSASIAISPHGFSKQYEDRKKFGRFNAGFIYWRNDADGLRCLADYRVDCFQWCEPQVEPDGRFMNQGYLTQWPQRYPGTHVIRHPGVNLSWWNIAGHSLTKGDDIVFVDGEPLIFYHFSSLFLDFFGAWNTFREFGDNLKLGLEAIYGPYLEEVARTDRWLRKRMPNLMPIERVSNVPGTAPVHR